MLYSHKRNKKKTTFKGLYILIIQFFSVGIRFGDFFSFFNLSSQVDEQRQGPVVMACRRAECRDSALVSTAFFMDLFGGYAESVALFLFLNSLFFYFYYFLNMYWSNFMH